MIPALVWQLKYVTKKIFIVIYRLCIDVDTLLLKSVLVLFILNQYLVWYLSTIMWSHSYIFKCDVSVKKKKLGHFYVLVRWLKPWCPMKLLRKCEVAPPPISSGLGVLFLSFMFFLSLNSTYRMFLSALFRNRDLFGKTHLKTTTKVC